MLPRYLTILFACLVGILPAQSQPESVPDALGLPSTYALDLPPHEILTPPTRYPDASYGSAIGVGPGCVIVGAPRDDFEGPDAGAAYVHERTASGFDRVHRLSYPGFPSGYYVGAPVTTTCTWSLVGVRGPAGGAGVALVYKRDPVLGWQYHSYITPPSLQSTDNFPSHMRLSANRAVIGMDQRFDTGASGKAFVYVLQGDAWVLESELEVPGGSPGDDIGFTTDLSDDGRYAILGASGADGGRGEAHVFFRDAATGWRFHSTLQAPDRQPGDRPMSVAIEGGVALMGASSADTNGPDAGAVYSWRLVGGVWSFIGKLVPPDAVANGRFGFSLAYADGVALIGSPNNGSGVGYVYDLQGSEWTLRSRLRDLGEGLGGSTGIHGSTGAIGADRASGNRGQAIVLDLEPPAPPPPPAPQPIVLTRPAAGDVLTAGTTVAIEWDRGSGLDDTLVSIILKRVGEPNQRLASRIENSGSFLWDIPVDQPEHADYYLFITYDLADNTRVKARSGTFSILGGAQPDAVALTAPTHGEVIEAGSAYPITWDPGDVDPDLPIDLFLKRPGERNVLIARRLRNGQASYTWRVGADLPAADDYYVFARYDDPARGRQKPRSGTFSVATPDLPPTVSFFAPTAGQSVAIGERLVIGWSPGAVAADATIKLVLKRRGEPNVVIANDALNTGVFEYTIPATVSPADDWYVFAVVDDPIRGRIKPRSATFSIEGSAALADGAAPLKGVTASVPTELALGVPTPNPARTNTDLVFALPTASHVDLSVVDLQGREVARLVDGDLPAGLHRVRWMPGASAPGVYLVRLIAADGARVRRFVVVR